MVSAKTFLSARTARSAAGRTSTSRTSGRPDRGRPGLADQPRPAVPEGLGEQAAGHQPGRLTKVRYRRPYGTEWEDLDLDTAMDMIADRVIAAREDGLAGRDDDGKRVDRTLGFAQPRRRDARQRGELPHQEALHRDGRDPDREPGPHMTLLHGPRSGDLVRARRRHHFQQDLQNADCIVIQGSNMAEATRSASSG
jgi:formate dehydrogenase major subunit